MDSIPYASNVESLTYVMVYTRSNISYDVSLQTLKWILKYIKGSISRVLIYGGAMNQDEHREIEGFLDSNYAKCMDTMKSLSSYIFTMFGTSIY